MKQVLKKKKILIFSVLILIGFFASFSVVLGAGFFWFGGRIASTTQCTCSSGSQVSIIGYPSTFTGTYLYSPATQLRTGKGIPGGNMILGIYSPGGSCMMAGDPCTSLPITKGTMKIIGTN